MWLKVIEYYKWLKALINTTKWWLEYEAEEFLFFRCLQILQAILSLRRFFLEARTGGGHFLQVQYRTLRRWQRGVPKLGGGLRVVTKKVTWICNILQPLPKNSCPQNQQKFILNNNLSDFQCVPWNRRLIWWEVDGDSWWSINHQIPGQVVTTRYLRVVPQLPGVHFSMSMSFQVDDTGLKRSKRNQNFLRAHNFMGCYI